MARKRTKKKTPKSCKRCGSRLHRGRCSDVTCPFNDHDQSCNAGWSGHQSKDPHPNDDDRPITCTCEKSLGAKKKQTVEGTLILAYDSEGGLEPKDIFVFHAVHEPLIRDIRLPLKAAFEEWSKTSGGKEYIEDNGANWGDATEIPNEILAKHGIQSYENAETMSLDGSRQITIVLHHRIIVDHNESLVHL